MAKDENKPIEEMLWESANKLRGSVDAAEYKHVVLGLVFLKFISDKYEARKQELIEEGKEQYIEMKDAFAMKNVFYVPQEARWSYLVVNAKQGNAGQMIDSAFTLIEKENESLKGVLPKNYYSRRDLDSSNLGSLIDTINNIETTKDSEEDIVGRVYEYFLGKFARAEGKLGGEFYTPKSVVKTITEMIEPYEGKIYDPACGSAGLFVQSMKFVENHQGSKKDISIYGQEKNSTTWRLAKMNLAIRGINANLGEMAADTFHKDLHKDLKADFVMANPPFNMKEWRNENELVDDERWIGYTTPPTGNANYGWILNMVSKLSNNGTAGFVLANGSLSTEGKAELEIRKQLIENDLVECIVAMPEKLFYTTGIPVCLWFITKNKKQRVQKTKEGMKTFRNRTNETLFIDARKLGTMVERTLRELSDEDIKQITDSFHAWRGNNDAGQYEDVQGFCKSAKLEEIKENNYNLTPGRYVGIEELEDDGIPFEEKMETLSSELFDLFNKSDKLQNSIKEILGALGYED
jgi:type I restriction enzyme M protein